MSGGFARSVRVVVLAAIAVIAFTASAAAATPASTSAFRQSFDSRYVAYVEFDGADVYWIETRSVPVKNGIGVNSRLVRRSIGGGPITELFRTSADDYEQIVDLYAGGGVVAIQIDRDFGDDRETVETRVVRMSRDGSNPVEVAKGAQSLETFAYRGRKAKPELADCGTAVSLQDVSPSGEVAFGTLVAQRTASECGGTENSNSWNYSALRLDGSTRAITTVKAPVRMKIRRFKRGYAASCRCGTGMRLVALVGDWAMVSQYTRDYEDAGHRIVNLTTGLISDGYSTTSQKGTTSASFDSQGRVAIMNIQRTVGRKRKSGKRKVGRRFKTISYPSPGSTADQIRVTGDPIVRYCGSRLIGLNRSGRGTKLYEYDPFSGMNLGPVAVVAEGGRWGFDDCDEDSGYFSRESRGRLRVLAVRFD